MANDSHDPLAGSSFELFTEEIARLCNLVEDGESHVPAQEPCRSRRLLLDEGCGDPEECCNAGIWECYPRLKDFVQAVMRKT